jgi:uncharacterized DUF497 family protein
MSGLAFEWDEHNLPKIAAYNVTPEEIEQAMANDPILVQIQRRGNEGRALMAGITDEGRVLGIVLTYRGMIIRVITAQERRSYRALFGK